MEPALRTCMGRPQPHRAEAARPTRGRLGTPAATQSTPFRTIRARFGSRRGSSLSGPKSRWPSGVWKTRPPPQVRAQATGQVPPSWSIVAHAAAKPGGDASTYAEPGDVATDVVLRAAIRRAVAP